MPDPILVEVLRGAAVESRHAGAVAVCDARGGRVLALGDVDAPVFPRSAVKAFQALPLVESGAAERVGFTAEHLALAIASHGGEPVHVETAAAMLALAGRDEATLECGSHAPTHRPSAEALVRAGQAPCPLHNNCSGKHAGFIALACDDGGDPAGYVRPDHPAMRRVMAANAEMAGAALDGPWVATDGCSIPTQAAPLAALAQGFARFGTGKGLDSTRAAAAARLRAAAAAHPHLVAGSGRFDTAVMSLLGARAFVKGGAEGVHCAALPELGLGIAIKCDDGGARASEVAMAALLARLLPLSADEEAGLAPHVNPVLRNWNRIAIGALRPAAALAG